MAVLLKWYASLDRPPSTAIANRTGVDLEEAFRQKNARNQTRTWGG
jgi:hypothetical protein